MAKEADVMSKPVLPMPAPFADGEPVAVIRPLLVRIPRLSSPAEADPAALSEERSGSGPLPESPTNFQHRGGGWDAAAQLPGSPFAAKRLQVPQASDRHAEPASHSAAAVVAAAASAPLRAAVLRHALSRRAGPAFGTFPFVLPALRPLVSPNARPTASGRSETPQSESSGTDNLKLPDNAVDSEARPEDAAFADASGR